MFTLEQIKAAHSKVRSGADFPAYVQEIGVLGVRCYENHVHDGHIYYQGAGGFTLLSAPRYEEKLVAESANVGNLQDALKAHQAGETDFPTFCGQAAAAGVVKWKVDIQGLTCTYYDKAGNKMVVEEIPVI